MRPIRDHAREGLRQMLRQQINDAMKQAMRDKDPITLSTTRLILAALKDRDIEARGRGNKDGLSDDEILAMLQTMVKQRREASSLYEQGGRLELKEQEEAEMGVIQRFLPQPLSTEETKAAIAAVIADTGAESIRDMGKVMAELRARYAGRMDFGAASGEVKAALQGG